MTTPIKDKKTMTVANHLFSDIMLKLGFPRILHFDNGTEFKSYLIENLFSANWNKKDSQFPLPPTSKWKTGIVTQIFQRLCLEIFCRWCS